MQFLSDFWAWLETLPALVWVLLGLAVAALPVIQSARHRAQDRARFEWNELRWQLTNRSLRGIITPCVRVEWTARGTGEAQDVTYEVSAPGKAWRRFLTDKTFKPSQTGYMYVSLIDGTTFNSTITAPTKLSRDLEDVSHLAKPGKYRVRIKWYEAHSPKKQRERIFSHDIRA